MPAPYSLVLDLEVEVPGEPVIEKGLLNVAGRCHLPAREKTVSIRDGSSQNQGEIPLPELWECRACLAGPAGCSKGSFNPPSGPQVIKLRTGGEAM